MSAGKEVVFMPPHYSSQECSECHHTSKENRLTQSGFKCIVCGHIDNADVNAAKVLVYRYKQQLARGPQESLNGHGGKVTTAAMSQTELMKCQEAPAIANLLV
jgi:putative transposase